MIKRWVWIKSFPLFPLFHYIWDSVPPPFILSFSIKNDNFWRLWLSYHPSRHPLSGRHCADHTSTGTLWFYESIVRHSNTHWVTWNNLWKQDFATICKTPLHCLCGFTLKLLWPWKRNYWCQRVFNFTNKELSMGNIHFLFLCFSHLYVFCINQRLRDKQP